MANPKVSSGSRTAPSILAAAPWAPVARTTSDDRNTSPLVSTPTTVPFSMTGSASAPKRTSAPAAMAMSNRWLSNLCRGHTAPWLGKRSVVGHANSRCFLPAIMRNPSMRWATEWSMPNSSSAPMARGVSPSPHTLSRPCGPFSHSTTLRPARAAEIAAAEPPGPPPMMAMSNGMCRACHAVFGIAKAGDPPSRSHVTSRRMTTRSLVGAGS